VGDEEHRFGSGFYRFRPDGSKLEFLRSTNNNSWGCGFSEEGLVFGSTANGNPSEHMPLANRVYERVRGWSATTLGGIAGSPEMELAPRASGDGSVAIRQVDHHGRFTAAAGGLYAVGEVDNGDVRFVAPWQAPSGANARIMCLSGAA
jgi:hypothetical protein